MTTCQTEAYYNGAGYQWVLMELPVLQQWLDLFTGKAIYTPPPLFLRLLVNPFSPPASASEINPIYWSSYTRQDVTGGWSPASGGAALYPNTLEWGIDGTFVDESPSSLVDLFDVTLWWANGFDAPTGGNLLFQCAFGSLTNANDVVEWGFHFWTQANGLAIGFSSVAAAMWGGTPDNWTNGVGFATPFLDRLIDHFLGTAPFGTPPQMWLALLSTPSTAGGIGTEVAYGGYKRIQVTSAQLTNASIFGPAVHTHLAADVLFPLYGAGGTLPVNYFAVMDAPIGGNLVAGGAIPPTLVPSGFSPRIPNGTILFTFSQ